MEAMAISKGAIKSIYALGAKLGMVERDAGHEDALHQLIAGLTGKTGVTALTPAEAQTVLAELRRRSGATTAHKRRPRKYEELPGGVTAAQQKKIWYLMFQLERYDPAPDGVQLRDRLCGLVGKMFSVTAIPAQPMRFLSSEQGSALIDALSRITAEKAQRHLPDTCYRREQEAMQNAE